MNRMTLLTLPITTAGLMAGDACVMPMISIPDNNAVGVSVPIELSVGIGDVVDAVTVGIDVLHPWVGDLVITLQSPEGTTVGLLDRPGIPSSGFPGPYGCGGRNISVVFDDLASAAAEDVCSYAGQPVLAGGMKPNGSLSSLVGEQAVGEWIVRVADVSGYDVGVLVEVCLDGASSPGCAPDLTGDGQLDFFDVSAFLSAYAMQQPDADFTGDEQYDFFDVSAFLAEFNMGCPG
jgi:hypothetical protein